MITSNGVINARGVAEKDLEGKNAEFTTPPKIAGLLAWADSTASF